MRTSWLICGLAGALWGLGCGGSERPRQPAPGVAAGGAAWQALRLEAGAGGDNAAPPLSDADLDRMLDALEQEIDKR